MIDAACSGLSPRIFYQDAWSDLLQRPQSTAGLARARAICATCPARLPCLEAGLTEDHGIWGGLTPPERRAVVRQRRKETA